MTLLSRLFDDMFERILVSEKSNLDDVDEVRQGVCVRTFVTDRYAE